MATKSILVAVTDEKALAEITQALGKEWGVTSVSSEADATAQFEKRAFDALLVDFNLGSPDASELLNQVLEKHPQTIRFLSVYEADLALVAAKVNGTHHILPKPIEAASLRSRIENALKDSGSEPSATDSANAAPESPKISSVYAEVLKALESPNVTNKQVGKILARDAELTAEILKLTNSSYLGLPRNITSPAEAVGALGFETVKAVVMAQQFLAEHKEMVPCYLSLEQIWQHSVNVGQIARDLVLFETKDRALASQALVAGLLHDLGKVVLAKNFEDLYGRVTSLARKQPVALWEVEKEMFGASHGEIGGCLLGMWNLPLAIVDAAALHHEPPLGEHDRLSPLAAVHIANVIERELRPNEDGMMVAPVIHAPFLNEIGLLHRLPVWRAAFANRRAVDLEGGRTARTGNLLQGPAGETETGTWGQTEGIFRNRRNWILAGVTGGLVALALWFRTPSGPDQSDVVYARTPSAQEEVTVAAAKPLPEAAPTVVAPVAVAEEKLAVSARTETISKPAAA